MSTPPVSSAPASTDLALRWPLFLGGLLAAQAGICLVVVHLATSDPSARIETDAYARGISWDAARAQEARLQALGLTLTASVSPPSGLPPRREVSVTLTERTAGPPLTGVSVRGFAHASARAGYEVELSPAGAARFSAAIPTRKGGLHRLEIRFRRGSEELHHVVDVLAEEAHALPAPASPTASPPAPPAGGRP